MHNLIETLIINVFQVPAEKIRVGRDYQVVVPEFVPVNGT